MKTAYLGPEGSYSYLAAKKMTPSNELCAYDSFPQIMRALTSGEVDCTVIPIENNLNGGVIQNIDLLQATPDIIAVEEGIIKIEHRLATLNGADIKRIKRVYSHRQALDQCAGYLFENFPKAQLIAVPSTSASLDMIKTEEDAGIVGAHTQREGITLSENNIADYSENVTHFLKVVRGQVDENKSTKKIYFSVTCPNVSGGLLNLLKRIAFHGLNMSKLQSRPIKDAVDEFRFFIEAECDYSEPEIKKAIEDIKSNALSFKLLGAY
ncbi:MAG: hypothetical protein K2N23_08010 [Clostridia bacterium]|nr:hypothetical protein [Clostridia bacterium]